MVRRGGIGQARACEGDPALRIVLFGLGHVGATMAACLARAGHAVLGVDPDPVRVAAVAEGRAPVAEPGLADLLLAGRAAGWIEAAPAAGAAALAEAELAVVCVATPPAMDGSGLDLSALLAVAGELGAAVRARRRRGGRLFLLVFRSTVPPGTMEGAVLPAVAGAAGEGPGEAWEAAYNPEFLREASALADYLAPSRIVVGERAPGAARRLHGLYDGIDAPLLEVPFAVAEMAKLVDNGWHALKVAFANEVGRACAGLGIGPGAVADLLLADARLNLGPAYLRPGMAYGGACLPKDLRTLTGLAEAAGLELPVLAGVAASNALHLDWLVRAVAARVGPPGPVLQLGLSFKPGTDDLRGSPLLALAERLVAQGYALRVVDPDLDPARLPAGAATHAALLERCLAAEPEAAAKGVRLVLLGKPGLALPAGVPAGVPVLDLARLEGLTTRRIP
jgi:GDP-mannose 6-dehydrogenase